MSLLILLDSRNHFLLRVTPACRVYAVAADDRTYQVEC